MAEGSRAPRVYRDFDQVWKMVTHIREIEDQFNQLISFYRKMASTWLLAVFAAIGFILTKEITPGIDKFLIIAFIGLAGGVGVWMLWNIDIMVYQLLLNAAFDEGVKLEEEYKDWLPQIRNNMRSSQVGGIARTRLVWFYIIGSSVPFTISVAAASFWLAGQKSPSVSWPFAAILGALLIVAYSTYLYKCSTQGVRG